MDFFLCSGVSQCSFQGEGQVPRARMERASRVSGRARVSEQFLSKVAGSRSGPVALQVSSELRSRRVCLVRKSMKLLVPVVSACLFSSLSSWFSSGLWVGTEGSVNFDEKVLAKRLVFVVASCTQVPLFSFSGGMLRRGASLFRSCRLMRHHFSEFRGSCVSWVLSLFW